MQWLVSFHFFFFFFFFPSFALINLFFSSFSQFLLYCYMLLFLLCELFLSSFSFSLCLSLHCHNDGWIVFTYHIAMHTEKRKKERKMREDYCAVCLCVCVNDSELTKLLGSLDGKDWTWEMFFWSIFILEFWGM